jgi:hypothetical protein
MKTDLERFKEFFTEMGVDFDTPDWYYQPHVSVGHTDFVFGKSGNFVSFCTDSGDEYEQERLVKTS